MTIETMIAIAVSVFLFVYLLYTLLRPERF
jgi:K+-transporting ATPase KdpF subunit